MSTIGTVVISALIGMFALGLLIALGVLIYLAFDLRKALAASKEEKSSVYAETRAAIAGNQAEMKAILETGKSTFASIRAEVKTLLEDHRKQTKALLEEHRKATQAGIDKINAEALTGAAARTIQASQRLEKIATLLQQMILDTEPRATHEYGPEEYAPEQRLGMPPSGFNLSTTAVLDEEVEQATVQQLPLELAEQA